MKTILKISALILVVSQLSFSNERKLNVAEKKLLEVVEKYHLVIKNVAPPANAKRFATLHEMENYLKSRKKVVAKATGKIYNVKYGLSEGTYGTSSNTVGNWGGYYSVSLDFEQFRIDGYADTVTLSWSSYYVSSGMGATNWNPTKPGLMSFAYDHRTGTLDGQLMSVTGDYIEYIFFSGTTYELKSDFALSGTWNLYDTLDASATIEP